MVPDKQRPIVSYISFLSSEDKKKFLKETKNANCCQRLCCRKKHEHKKLQNKWVKIKKGPEPSDLLWENLDVGNVGRFIRVILGILVTIILLAASIMSIVSTKKLQDDATRGYDISKCDKNE